MLSRFSVICNSNFCSNLNSASRLKVAIIGQSNFAAEVFKILRKQGHKVVGVFTVPDKGNREDPLASTAHANGTPVFKISAWRKGQHALRDVWEQYKDVDADLNVLPFCTQFIPMDVIDYPLHKSICYHPSLLPKHRGVSSINWTLIAGDTTAGFTIFWADDGLDTGPILLQQSCSVEPNETVDTLYNRFLYPEGIKAMAKAVDMVANGTAPRITQKSEDALLEPSLKKKERQEINWSLSGTDIHNFIRGLDSSPGAWTRIEKSEVKLYGSKVWNGPVPNGDPLLVSGMAVPAIRHTGGILFSSSDNTKVNVERLLLNGKMIPAANFGRIVKKEDAIELTGKEKLIIPLLNTIWKNIINIEINNDTNFFSTGAGSMDVVRLVEEIKSKLNITTKNEHVFMAPVFEDFCYKVVTLARGNDLNTEIRYRTVDIVANNLNLKFPQQLFINGEFIDSDNGQTVNCINPTDESIICQVQCATPKDVDRAVKAAKEAFYNGEWSKISNRERGVLLMKLAELMEENKEELATIESLDSGAVYTLALKTHIGMSIETWRYFAGWTDKIHGSTIPISHARPNRNFTYTRKEPIGVCGLITPWNYPLMMLSWKMAACIAAGNVVVMKPSEVSPLSALKFAELTIRAGFPPGVINVLPGTGAETGMAIANHPDIRKLGFTGSTQTGKIIMHSAANTNLKKVSLELGGKSPLVIFDDCDLDKSVRMAMGGVFFNKGENCIAAGRVFVAECIHDDFVKRVLKEIKNMVIGDPFNRSTHHGPQNHKKHLDKLVAYCKSAVADGAKLVIGGRRCDRPGYFFEPTVFTYVEDHMCIAKEEAFGPIMAISSFNSSDVDSVIKRANNSDYGLASGVFTKDINRALYFIEKIDAGTVFINTYNKTDVAAPFGGFKQSGFGKDLGKEALDEYLKVKCVTMEY